MVMCMKMKKVYKRLFLIISLVLLTFFTVYIYSRNNNYSKLVKSDNNTYNDKPIYIDYMDEFNIKDSNYI